MQRRDNSYTSFDKNVPPCGKMPSAHKPLLDSSEEDCGLTIDFELVEPRLGRTVEEEFIESTDSK